MFKTKAKIRDLENCINDLSEKLEDCKKVTIRDGIINSLSIGCPTIWTEKPVIVSINQAFRMLLDHLGVEVIPSKTITEPIKFEVRKKTDKK
jgi:hypothetical protein